MTRVRRGLMAVLVAGAAVGLVVAPARANPSFSVVTTLNVTFESEIVVSGGFAYVASDSAITIIDTASNTVAATVPTTGATDPRGAATAGGNVYFVARTSATLVILNTSTRAVSYLPTTGCTNPNSIIAFSASRVVVNCHGNARVLVINVAGPSIAATLTVGSGPRGMSAGGDFVYVPNSSSNSVSVINAAAATPSVVATVNVGSQPEFTTVFEGKVYVVNFNGNTASIINASNNTVLATVAVGGNPQGVRACRGNVYTANRWTGNTSVISPSTNAVTQTITVADVGALTHVMGVEGNHAYFLNFDRSSVSAVNCDTQQLAAVISTVAGPAAIAFSDLYAYVTGTNQITVFALPSSSSSSVDPSQRPPDWMKQVGRAPGSSCEPGWNPSWAEWPNGGSGGFVCEQVMTWSDRAQGFVVRA